MDGVLHPSHPCIFVLASPLRVLEDGRLLLGRNQGGAWGEGKETHCSREWIHLLIFLFILFRFVQDEGKFDPRSIPLKSWNDYVRIADYVVCGCVVLIISLGKRALGQGVEP